MTEGLQWYGETTGGVRQGSCSVTERSGVLHLAENLPVGKLKTVKAELPWIMAEDEKLFMNGYQTWTYSPELNSDG